MMNDKFSEHQAPGTLTAKQHGNEPALVKHLWGTSSYLEKKSVYLMVSLDEGLLLLQLLLNELELLICYGVWGLPNAPSHLLADLF